MMLPPVNCYYVYSISLRRMMTVVRHIGIVGIAPYSGQELDMSKLLSNSCPKSCPEYAPLAHDALCPYERVTPMAR